MLTREFVNPDGSEFHAEKTAVSRRDAEGRRDAEKKGDGSEAMAR
jgi:hypothetical protein